MTNQELLKIIKDARVLLDRTYIKWQRHDLRGGHCHMGCIEVVAGNAKRAAVMDTLDEACRRLHPELVGASALRDGWRMWIATDNFDMYPGVYVNNQLGKEAILAVYDDEIARLEVAILVEEEEKHADCLIPDTRIADRIVVAVPMDEAFSEHSTR